MQVLGAYYGLPVLSMRAALYPLLLSGTKGFNVSRPAGPQLPVTCAAALCPAEKWATPAAVRLPAACFTVPIHLA